MKSWAKCFTSTQKRNLEIFNRDIFWSLIFEIWGFEYGTKNVVFIWHLFITSVCMCVSRQLELKLGRYVCVCVSYLKAPDFPHRN